MRLQPLLVDRDTYSSTRVDYLLEVHAPPEEAVFLDFVVVMTGPFEAQTRRSRSSSPPELVSHHDQKKTVTIRSNRAHPHFAIEGRRTSVSKQETAPRLAHGHNDIRCGALRIQNRQDVGRCTLVKSVCVERVKDLVRKLRVEVSSR